MPVPVQVEHLEGSEFQKSRAFSPAIVTTGGKTVWLAGQTATKDMNGNAIAHDFEAQARTCFQLIGRTLARAGVSRPTRARVRDSASPSTYSIKIGRASCRERV